MNFPEIAEPLPSTFRLVKVHSEREVVVAPFRRMIDDERVIVLTDVTLIDMSVTDPLSAENRALLVPPLTLNSIELKEAEGPCKRKTAVGRAGDLSEERVFVGTVDG